MKWVDVRKKYRVAIDDKDYSHAHQQILESIGVDENKGNIDYYELGEFYEDWGKVLWKQGNKTKAREIWKLSKDQFENAGCHASGSGEGLAAMSAIGRIDQLIKVGILIKS